MALLNKPVPVDFSLTIMGGSDKGTVINLIVGKITIGRGSDNDIVIKDDSKVSRNHAKLVVTPNGVQISDISDRNKLVVNGQTVKGCELRNGAVIELGDTRFRFHANGAALSPHGVDLEPSTDAAIVPFTASVAEIRRPSPTSAPRLHSRMNQKSNVFYVVLAVVVIFFLWILMSKTNTTSKTAEATDPVAIIANNEKTVEEINAEREREGHNSAQYKEAQPNFIKGFRDYYKGQYERAIESFQACLSLFPDHKQCQRYLQLSQKKKDELVQYHMILGGKYKEQGQYRACSSEYQNVLEMVKDRSQKIFQEALSGRDACNALNEENL